MTNTDELLRRLAMGEVTAQDAQAQAAAILLHEGKLTINQVREKVLGLPPIPPVDLPPINYNITIVAGKKVDAHEVARVVQTHIKAHDDELLRRLRVS